MRNYLYFFILWLVLFPSAGYAESKGSVCLGSFLSIVWYEPLKRPYLTIDNSEPFRFEQGVESTRLVVENLDLAKIHKVKIHFDGKVVESWNLDFNKLYTDMVYIWRSKGAWHMEPITNGKCEYPARKQ